MLLVDEEYKKGFLSINDEGFWEFVLRDTNGNVTDRHDICDIQYSWKMRLQENTFDIGWDEHKARRIFGCGRHVSATDLHNNYAPPNLKTAFASNNKDRKIWRDAYDEEYDGLNSLNVFTEITTKEYENYLKKHGEDARAIPTMNIFTIKPNMDGNPV